MVRSSPPPNAGLVYTLLITVGLLAAMVGGAAVAYITYMYVWDDDAEQRRNPVPLDDGAGHAELPAWIVQA